MKMIIIQELKMHDSTDLLDLFAEHGAPPGTEQLYVSADGRHVFAIGDYDDMTDSNRLAELYQPAYAGPAQYFPVLSPEVAVPHTIAGIASRS